MPHTMEKLLALLEGKANGIQNLEWRINMAAKSVLGKALREVEPCTEASRCLIKLHEEISNVA